MKNKKSNACFLDKSLAVATLNTLFIFSMGLHNNTRAATSSNPDAITPDGGQYYGQLVDGKLQGHGKLVWVNGAQYEGEFDKGLTSGKGKYRSSTGIVYEGNFKNGMLNGEGRMVDLEGGIY